MLSIASKVFVRVVFARLQILADRLHPESQGGFINNRSSIDLFTSRLIQEKCREQQHFIILIRSLRDGTEAAVQFKGSLSDKFAVHNCLYTLMAAMANACEGSQIIRTKKQ